LALLPPFSVTLKKCARSTAEANVNKIRVYQQNLSSFLKHTFTKEFLNKNRIEQKDGGRSLLKEDVSPNGNEAIGFTLA
jgi:hypothetical protein